MVDEVADQDQRVVCLWPSSEAEMGDWWDASSPSAGKVARVSDCFVWNFWPRKDAVRRFIDYQRQSGACTNFSLV